MIDGALQLMSFLYLLYLCLCSVYTKGTKIQDDIDIAKKKNRDDSGFDLIKVDYKAEEQEYYEMLCG